MPSGSNNGDVLVAVPSPYIPFREIAAGGIFGTGIDKGLVIMLRAYFDDSGTHPTSDAVLLGGLIGTCEQWNQFESEWAAKLAARSRSTFFGRRKGARPASEPEYTGDAAPRVTLVVKGGVGRCRCGD
jgi:hypothetical protein